MHQFRLPGRIAAASLAAALLLTAPASAFIDTQGHWAEGAILKWSEEYHLIQGYDDDTFRPDNSITRGAFAGVLDRFLKFQEISPADTFSDTPGEFWEEAILKLHAAGVYLGNEGKAQVNAPITRQQAVTMIARAFQIEGEPGTLPYWDADQVADYALGAIGVMTDKGYISDSWDGNFRPTEPITRAEIINIMSNMIQMLIHETGTYSGDVAGTVMINSADGAALENMHISGDLFIAPGVTGKVTFSQVKIDGELHNFSGNEPVELDQQEPEKPGIRPEDVYTPGTPTGEYITYDGKKIPVHEGVEPIRLGEGDFRWEGDRLVYEGEDYRTRFGIDVSAYQNRASKGQQIDWDAAYQDGVDFSMVRIGLRGTSTGTIHADAFYRENIEGSMAAGIETGVYFFAQAITVEEAIEEADFVIGLLDEMKQDGVKIDGPVAYDWEMHDSSYRVYGTTPEMATACAVAFCQRIEEAGYDAMIYAGQYVNYIKYDQGAIEPYARWYPEYKSSKSEKLYPTFFYQMDYWQFSSQCKIDGIGGPVDANIQFLP